MAEVAAAHGRNAALQELIERIYVFSSAPENNGANANFGNSLGSTFTAYANFLADDGALETATQYVFGRSTYLVGSVWQRMDGGHVGWVNGSAAAGRRVR